MSKYKVTILNPSESENDVLLVGAYNLAQRRTVLSDYLGPGEKRTYDVHKFVELRIGRVDSEAES